MNTLTDELKTYEARTKKSKAAHERALKTIPLGVGSNYRFYEPYPLFVSKAQGGHLWDLDGNEYIDFNLCFGALMSGHCHPALQRAVTDRMGQGTMYGMPHELEAEMAEEISKRFPAMERVRFGNGGADVTMYCVRLARAFTGRDKIIKIEGSYHGGHDAVVISMKPPREAIGDPRFPNSVPTGKGIPNAVLQNTIVAPFNDLDALKQIFEKHRGQIAGLITEPILMNLGICMPDEGYLQGVARLCAEHGAVFILDEVKTGCKLAYGGACEYFGLKPDLVALAKSIGGGVSLAAFGGRADIMQSIADGKVFHAGTYNMNPLVLAAGLATLREALSRDVYPLIEKFNQMLLDGYNAEIKKNGLTAYMAGAGANGAIMFSDKVVRNYRDWLDVDANLWRHYWFAMTNRGVLAQPYWWDEQWTLCVAHTEQDIQKHLAVFAEIAPALAAAQKSGLYANVKTAGH
ncbi:MAG: glutamate-1-semialdehyde 2,1-aminomutase [Acidobacteria bacterium]|nr:glutamate-1-semialdehyde 2,1-aminomutase [Acidobacteriota bacterium]